MSPNVKGYLPYASQVALLASRGMDVGDPALAAENLRRINYYRLSGYWYPYRQVARVDPDGVVHRGDAFVAGTALSDVVALYNFDATLRAAAFAEISRVELTIRALLGHELGRVDPMIHLDPDRLGPTARGRSYQLWREGYERTIAQSREDFVRHHRDSYGGRLPIWVAVETLDWGALTYLFGFSPRPVQEAVASASGLTGPQFSTWMRSLNLQRNVCAHHGRLYNRVHTSVPRLPALGVHADLDSITGWTRTFAQLSLVQFLLDRLDLGARRLLPNALKTFPQVQRISVADVGALHHWQAHPLWRITS